MTAPEKKQDNNLLSQGNVLVRHFLFGRKNRSLQSQLTNSPRIVLHAPILDCLGHMGGREILRSCKVGNGTGDFKDTMIGTSGQAKPIYGIVEQTIAFLIQCTKFLDLAGAHLGIAVNGR